MKKSLLLLILSAVLLACGPATPGPCDKDKVQAAAKQLLDIVNKWHDAYQLASSASRISLAAPVQSLQAIKRDTESLDVPKCLTAARGYLSDHMNASITGFLDFMAQKSDGTVQSDFDKASAALSEYTDEMKRIAACAPDCK